MEHCNEQVGGGFRPPDGVCRLLTVLYAPACYAQGGCKQAAVRERTFSLLYSLLVSLRSSSATTTSAARRRCRMR